MVSGGSNVEVTESEQRFLRRRHSSFPSCVAWAPSQLTRIHQRQDIQSMKVPWRVPWILFIAGLVRSLWTHSAQILSNWERLTEAKVQQTESFPRHGRISLLLIQKAYLLRQNVGH